MWGNTLQSSKHKASLHEVRCYQKLVYCSEILPEFVKKCVKLSGFLYMGQISEILEGKSLKMEQCIVSIRKVLACI